MVIVIAFSKVFDLSRIADFKTKANTVQLQTCDINPISLMVPSYTFQHNKHCADKT